MIAASSLVDHVHKEQFGRIYHHGCVFSIKHILRSLGGAEIALSAAVGILSTGTSFFLVMAQSGVCNIFQPHHAEKLMVAIDDIAHKHQFERIYKISCNTALMITDAKGVLQAQVE